MQPTRSGVLSGTLSARQGLLVATGRLVRLFPPGTWTSQRALVVLHRDKVPSLSLWHRNLELLLSNPRVRLGFPFSVTPAACSISCAACRTAASSFLPWVSGLRSLRQRGDKLVPSMPKKPGLALDQYVFFWAAMMIPDGIVLATRHELIVPSGDKHCRGNGSALLLLLALLLPGVELTSSCRHCYPSWPVAVPQLLILV